MALTQIELTANWSELPDDVAEFLAAVDERVRHFSDRSTISYRGFVPSDFVTVYHALRALTNSSLLTGYNFCEWGSGLGVVASLAALLGLNAVGIEIDNDLMQSAEKLAREHEIPVELIHGSFVPPGAEGIIDDAFLECDGALSLEVHADGTYDDLGMSVEDFDLIFAFPWPNDEALTARLFDRFAAVGALLLTYAESESVILRRKTSGE